MTTSREFLELVLSGEAVTAAHVDALVQEKVKEDEYIDYKSGTLLKKPPKERARIVREYLSGFANSEGGVVIFGIQEENERPMQVDGCDLKDVGGDLDDWASDCLKDIASYFNPLPKFKVVSHPQGEVLICAVGRSYNFVPVVEKGHLVHYLRLGHQMLPAPDYLVADLRLGRRARPNLEVRKAYVLNLRRVKLRPDNPQFFLEFDLVVEVENAGLVWAEGSLYGLIAVHHFEPSMTPQRIPNSLSEHVDLQSVQLQVGELWLNGHPLVLRGGSKLEKPFDTGTIHHTIEVPLALYGQVHPYLWRAALYLLARDSAPVWYQVDLRIDTELNKLFRLPHQPLGGLPNNWDGFSVKRTEGERPVVGWIQIEEASGGEGVD